MVVVLAARNEQHAVDLVDLEQLDLDALAAFRLEGSCHVIGRMAARGGLDRR